MRSLFSITDLSVDHLFFSEILVEDLVIFSALLYVRKTCVELVDEFLLIG